MAKDVHLQAEKMYHQILDILEELMVLYADIDVEDEGAADMDREIIDMLMEESSERGLDEESVERVLKAVAALGKKAREG